MRNLFTVLLFAASLAGRSAFAADHLDGTTFMADPTTDITDLYAWMSSDQGAGKLYLVMNVGASAGPTTKFSNAALYVFHINASKMFGDMAPNKFTVVCSFDMSQKISCWGPEGSNEFVTGDASNTAGIMSGSGKMKVFAGLRDDPFFFNIAGFRAVVAQAKAALMMDPMGCPKAAEGAAPIFVNMLHSDGMMGPAKDNFAKSGGVVPNYTGNVMSIVIALDKTLVTDASHALLGVWASTNASK